MKCLFDLYGLTFRGRGDNSFQYGDAINGFLGRHDERLFCGDGVGKCFELGALLADGFQRNTVRCAFESPCRQIGVAARFEPSVSAEDMYAPELAGDEYRAQVPRGTARELEQHGGRI